MGRSGCGKGTQGDLLKKFLNSEDSGRKVLNIETGARFRNFIKGEGYSHKLSREIYERNERQPDFLAVLNWGQMMIDEVGGDEHMILDGVPRSLIEAEVLDTAFDFYGRRAFVVHLNISQETAAKRLLARGRADDLDATKNNKRFEWFDKKVKPAIEYFKSDSRHVFLEVDAEQPAEEVHAKIIAALKTV